MVAQMASLMRSKNAGPFGLTIDIMFDLPENYEAVRNSGVISKSAISRIYDVPEDRIQLFNCDNALAIKVSLPRRYVQGDLRDADNYQGQQYAPLMGMVVTGPSA